jgi:alkylation response protein AidB-like acyl-CoA dehydrogenase
MGNSTYDLHAVGTHTSRLTRHIESYSAARRVRHQHERYFGNSRMLTIPDGTTQINQLIIGRTLTGLDAFG